MVAYHEVGHAIVSELLPLADPVHKVSILPRGMALGYTMQLPLQDKYLTTQGELLDDIAGLLGGRAAEKLIFGEATTGANSDLDRASEIARAMVCEFGMSDDLGPITLGKRHGNPFLGRDIMEDRNYSEDVAKSIDQEIRKIIDQSYDRAKHLLVENRDKMDMIVKQLLEKETIEREEFEILMYGEKRSPKDAASNEPVTATEGPQDGQAEKQNKPEGKTRLEPGVA
jgi:cell division protease FtsH